jgi:chromosome segregation ATPase
MQKEIIIVLLLIALFYLYQKNRSLKQHPIDSPRTLFSFEEEQLQEKVRELETALTQSQILEQSNQTKLQEQAEEISSLKNRLQVYEGVSASGSGENEKLKAVLNERDELKRANQNLELDKEKLEEELKKSQSLSEEDQEKLNNYDDLETERDEVIRDKRSIEQDLTATANRLKLKSQEVENKDQQIQRIKKEFSEKDTSLNKKLTEWKGKYNQKVKQFDEEQLESKKIESENEKLQEKIAELEKERSQLLKPMPGEFPEDQSELIKTHQEQLKKINLLFDDQATNYSQIDFNGLYSLLETIAQEQKKKKTSKYTNASSVNEEITD